MNPILFGVIAGLVFAAVDVALMIPMAFPDKKTAMLGAFLVSSGIQHFLFVPFVATLVPAWIPGPRLWTEFAGVALIAGGLGLIVPRTARLAGSLSGLMIFLWFVMLHIPRALAAADAASRRNEWTAVFEALAMSGIALLLAADPRAGASTPADAESGTA